MKLRELREKINKLNDDEKRELFLIIKNSIKFTKNKNGILINMSKWDDMTKTRIEKFIDFSDKNSEILKNREYIQNSLIEKSI
jgi:hypothetical protein